MDITFEIKPITRNKFLDTFRDMVVIEEEGNSRYLEILIDGQPLHEYLEETKPDDSILDEIVLAKWKKMSKLDGVRDGGHRSCAWCWKYYIDFILDETAFHINSCKGCPVYSTTGYAYCQRSPYDDCPDSNFAIWSNVKFYKFLKQVVEKSRLSV
jgi:hypothetical protein